MPGRLILKVEPRSVSAHPIFNPPGRAIFSPAVLYFPYCERRSHYGKYRTGGAFDTPTQSATINHSVERKSAMVHSIKPIYKIVQTSNCYSRISRNHAKADRYKTRFFCAKFCDERAKARSKVLTKRFLRINSRAGSILERVAASYFRKIPNKWLKFYSDRLWRDSGLF